MICKRGLKEFPGHTMIEQTLAALEK